MSDRPTICEAPGCDERCMPGTDYCVNHQGFA